MSVFKLPDLGEGLPDAIIREWYIKTGDKVNVDQPIVAMETAKALVDVPAPYAGTIEKLFGEVGDTIETGNPLISFVTSGTPSEKRPDSGTVVGSIESSDVVLKESATGVKVQKGGERLRATPAIRALARRLGVDLNTLNNGERITADQVRQAANKTTAAIPDDMQSLEPVRKAMVLSMQKSASEVVPVTISDDADINAWPNGTDISLRIIRAIEKACQQVPICNAYFNGKAMAYKLNEKINIGLAVDTEHGLYVPVLKDVAGDDDAGIRKTINRFKEQARSKSIPQEDLKGATIMLSNFGSIAARYANPIVIPPMVCIVGVGKIREDVVAEDGNAVVHRIMPLSITTDHRLVTGGEVVRFLAAMIEALK